MNHDIGIEMTMKLRKMKLSGMADELEKQNENPNEELRTFDERFVDLINAEWDLRYNKKLNRFLKNSTLRRPDASLDDTLYDPQRQLDYESIQKLSTCEWIDQKKNLIITGKSSTGKTYLANALGVCAIKQFKQVKYIKTSHLMNEISAAEIKGNMINELNRFASFSLLIIDDFGLMDLDPDKCRNLFEVLDSRDGRGSTLVISQLPVSKWYELFKNNTYADACMERMIRNAYRLEFNGKNMREPSL